VRRGDAKFDCYFCGGGVGGKYEVLILREWRPICGVCYRAKLPGAARSVADLGKPNILVLRKRELVNS
jgi:hypothetical protein